MTRLFFLALAGGLGTLARFGLSEAVKRHCGGPMPWGTWAVNVTGCFLFGLVWMLADRYGLLTRDIRLVVLVGFMGAFTTFSTYIFDCAGLLREESVTLLLLNFLGQNAAGFAALVFGMSLGRFCNR